MEKRKLFNKTCSMDSMKIIINADDLGKSLDVNNAIFKFMDEGLITSSTIMANGSSVEDAIERSKKYPNCSFGIHLNLTEFVPVSNNNDLSPILDKDGFFLKNKKIIKKTHFTVSLRKAIYLELCSQVEKLHSLGINISHIDSHHHIHVLNKMFPIIKQIQKKYSIKKIRISNNVYDFPDSFSARLLIYFKIIYRNTYKFKLKNIKYKSITTSGFGSLMSFYKAPTKYNLKHESIELSVHPGHKSYQKENSILKTDWYNKLRINNEFINYKQL